MRSWCLAALVALCGVPVLSAASGPAHLVADLKPGFAPLDETGATFDSYTAVNGRVIFLATLEGDVQPQCSLWTTDGTAAGTSWLAGLCDDVEPNDYTPQAGIWVTTGSMAFFTDYFGRFWRTDGTAEGTFRLGGGALKRGFSGVHRPLLGPDGRTIFFEGCTEAYGCEPWRSDGTPEGTVLLGDLQRGQESSDPEGFILDGRRVLFATYGASGPRTAAPGARSRCSRPPKGPIGCMCADRRSSSGSESVSGPSTSATGRCTSSSRSIPLGIISASPWPRRAAACCSSRSTARRLRGSPSGRREGRGPARTGWDRG